MRPHRILFLCLFFITVGCGAGPVHIAGTLISDKSHKKQKTTVQSCSNALAGNYQVGRSPTACGLDTEQAQSLSARYSDLVFNDGSSRDAEQSRYAQAIFQFISDYASSYFKRREDRVDGDGLRLWVDFVLSVAHQESIWSHYRQGEDGVLRYLKGDRLHGYGMMQIDDRSHKEFINSKKVYDLKSHFTYSMDMFYSAFQKVNKSPCNSKHTTQEKYRSVYSMYNGGFGAKCRWTGDSPWKLNDENFWTKYSQQKYLLFLSEEAFNKQQQKLVAMADNK